MDQGYVDRVEESQMSQLLSSWAVDGKCFENMDISDDYYRVNESKKLVKFVKEFQDALDIAAFPILNIDTANPLPKPAQGATPGVTSAQSLL